MDRKRSFLNVTISILFKLITLFTALYTRRLIINILGNDINGLNSLYTSIIGVLSIAELGVGSAITFCMYKPIIEKDYLQVTALYNLFNKVYYFISIVIFFFGLAIQIFLPILAKGYSVTNVNLHFTFFLMVMSTVISYMYSSKTSLINAYKNNYITTTISSIGIILQQILQIFALILTKSFTLFLLCNIFSAIFQWIITYIIFEKKYAFILHKKATINNENRNKVIKNIKAMFMHKIGGILTNSMDGVIISAFIGLSSLGTYSNYTLIMTSMVGVISLFFSPLTAIVGHMFINESLKKTESYFNFFQFLNFFVGLLFFLGYYATIDSIVSICFGNQVMLPRIVSYVITSNYFIQFMRQAVLLFRDSSGTFYYDRWKPLFEGLCNLFLSLMFVNILSADLKIVGVILSTILTNLFVCHVIEPYILFKYAFKKDAKKYYIINYFNILLFQLICILFDFIRISSSNDFVQLFINGGLSIIVSAFVIIILILVNKQMRYKIYLFLKQIINN